VRRSITLLAVLVLALACSREKKVAERVPEVIEDPRPQDGGTLLRRLDTDIATLNPVLATSRYDRYVGQYLFTPLLYLDRDLQPVPGLAKRWDVSDDGRTYRFELNKNATYSDGTPVRASDVLFTLRKIVDPASEAVQIASYFESLDLSRSRVIDEHTVEVAFRDVLASQLVRFSEVLIIPEHFYAKDDFKTGFNDKVLGSGPYRLVRRDPGKEVVLEKRKDSWGPNPHIQTVVFKVITDHGTGWNAIKRGDLDETLVSTDTWLREQNSPAHKGSIDFTRFYTLNYNFIAWNNRHPLLADKRFRRAMAMCIPVDSIIKDIFKGTARAMTGPYTPDQWGYNPEVPVIRYDPEEAKRIFAAAGWKDSDGDGVLDKAGRPYKFDLLIMSGNPTTRQFAQIVQGELKNIGVDMEVVLLDGSMAIQRILSGNYEAAYMSLDLDPDPDVHALFHSSQMPPRGQNFVFYANPEADRLIDQGRHELEPSKRKDIYQRLHAVLAEDQPYTWTVQNSAKWAIRTRVHGVAVSRGYGLFLWSPGELDWWIPLHQQKRP
jgi:peptide/nickel transport system substrate-binding protein